MAFGSFERKTSSQPMAEINMVPLIDVVLVLLVIFIVTAPLLTNVVKLDLPKATANAELQKPETLTLREGPLMVAAARRYGRVVSGGSQRVLEDYKEIVNPCWAGELGTIKSVEPKGAVITLSLDVEGYLRASEISNGRVEDAGTVLKAGDNIEAMIINVDRKSRSIQLSIKARDNAETADSMQRLSEARASSGTTNLGALLKAKLDQARDTD